MKLRPSGSRSPAADYEHTPAQRRIIDASLARADSDIKAGRVSKAYSDHAKFIAALHKEAAEFLSQEDQAPGQTGPKSRMTKRTQFWG